MKFKFDQTGGEEMREIQSPIAKSISDEGNRDVDDSHLAQESSSLVLVSPSYQIFSDKMGFANAVHVLDQLNPEKRDCDAVDVCMFCTAGCTGGCVAEICSGTSSPACPEQCSCTGGCTACLGCISSCTICTGGGMQ
jgi:hypothetical protein